MRRWCRLMLVVFCGLRAGAGEAESSAPALKVEVAVTGQTIRPKVPAIGFSLCQNPIDDRSTMLGNCLNSNPGLEAGILYRRVFLAGGGDANGFEEPAQHEENYRKSIPQEFWKGAEFRVLAGKAAGRRGKLAQASYADGRKTVYTAEGGGPAFAAGDLIWLSQEGALAQVHRSWSLTVSDRPDGVEQGDRAPWFGGRTCVKLGKDRPNIWLPTFDRWGGGRAGDRGGNSDRFLQEKTYRVTVWARGTPGAKCSVRFVASSEPGRPEPDDFAVTETWKKYELVRKSDPMVNLIIVASGGEVWLDNFIVSEDDGGEPLAVLPRVAGALAEFKPGVLRILSGARGESLENWLAHPLERLRTVEKVAFNQASTRDPDPPNLPDALDLCERAGAAPWLTVGLAMTEEEWDGLLEYLAGPAESPFGARRARHGQPDPWIGKFETIYLELGDEVWNRRKAPWNVENAEHYAAAAERVFSRARKNKHFGPRIRLVANGCLADPKWNETVLKYVPSMDVLGCGAALEFAQPGGNANAAGLLAQMLAGPARALPAWNAARQQAQSARKALALSGWETVSGEQGFLGQERSMLRGQASAVAALDGLLQALANGAEAAAFSRFAQGSNNATHVDAHAMALHPAGMALRLFNRHAGGKDLLAASVAPAADGPAPGVPALGAYAFKSGQGCGVFLLNRSPAQACAVRLKLPGSAKKATAYTLAAADPLANNLNDLQVDVKAAEIDLSGEVLVPAHGLVLVETK
ncbi:MAG: hypothetical protein KIS92_05535 [Planctomycetota bacterium]|nr:hypothetical protein [Planctomycetota bacterium]